jgi:methylmalonyl-CoA mutase C-terminal domain/subunit
MTIFPKVMQLLAEREVDDIAVIGGGVIQEADVPKLKAAGVRAIFDADATTQDLIDGIERVVADFGRAARRSRAAP